MIVEGYISRESDNPGYYRVVPSMGGSAVEAIDIHRVGNFVAGERVTIIQIGNEYGIAKASRALPSVLEVPKASREAMAEQNPAQYFCAYLGAQLGRFKRLYLKGEVQSVSGAKAAVKILQGLSAGETVEASILAGLVEADFEAGDIVALLDVSGALSVCGWWRSGAFDIPAWATAFVFYFQFTIRNASGAAIKVANEGSRPLARVIYGSYDFIGKRGAAGTFYPFDVDLGEFIPDEEGNVYLDFEDAFTSTPSDDWDLLPFAANTIRIEYTYAGKDYRKDFVITGNHSLSPPIMMGIDKVIYAAFAQTDGLFNGVTAGQVETPDLIGIVGHNFRSDESVIKPPPDDFLSSGPIESSIQFNFSTGKMTGNGSILYSGGGEPLWDSASWSGTLDILGGKPFKSTNPGGDTIFVFNSKYSGNMSMSKEGQSYSGGVSGAYCATQSPLYLFAKSYIPEVLP